MRAERPQAQGALEEPDCARTTLHHHPSQPPAPTASLPAVRLVVTEANSDLTVQEISVCWNRTAIYFKWV